MELCAKNLIQSFPSQNHCKQSFTFICSGADKCNELLQVRNSTAVTRQSTKDKEKGRVQGWNRMWHVMKRPKSKTRTGLLKEENVYPLLLIWSITTTEHVLGSTYKASTLCYNSQKMFMAVDSATLSLDKLAGISKSLFSNIRPAEKTWIVEIN